MNECKRKKFTYTARIPISFPGLFLRFTFYHALITCTILLHNWHTKCDGVAQKNSHRKMPPNDTISTQYSERVRHFRRFLYAFTYLPFSQSKNILLFPWLREAHGETYWSNN